MTTLNFQRESELKKVAEEIRTNLASLRERKNILENANEVPGRNPALDAMLHHLKQMQLDYTRRLSEIEADQSSHALEMPVVRIAQTILQDVREIVELLTWFGGKSTGVQEETS